MDPLVCPSWVNLCSELLNFFHVQFATICAQHPECPCSSPFAPYCPFWPRAAVWGSTHMSKGKHLWSYLVRVSPCILPAHVGGRVHQQFLFEIDIGDDRQYASGMVSVARAHLPPLIMVLFKRSTIPFSAVLCGKVLLVIVQNLRAAYTVQIAAYSLSLSLCTNYGTSFRVFLAYFRAAIIACNTCALRCIGIAHVYRVPTYMNFGQYVSCLGRVGGLVPRCRNTLLFRGVVGVPICYVVPLGFFQFIMQPACEKGNLQLQHP